MSRRTQVVVMILLWAIVVPVGVPLADNYKPWGAFLAWTAALALLFWLLRFRAASRPRNHDRTPN